MSSARQGLFAAAGFAEAQGSLHYRHKLRPHSGRSFADPVTKVVGTGYYSPLCFIRLRF
jgi:hypothetical protein